MKELYRKFLFEQYQNTLGTENLSYEEHRENFYKWLDERQKMVPNYVEFLLKQEAVKNKETLIEVGKAHPDTIIESVPENIHSIAITPFVTQYKTKKTMRGGLQMIKEEPMLYSHQYKHHIIKIAVKLETAIVTQLPLYNDEGLDILLKLAQENDIVIGAYGKIQDRDCHTNLRTLRLLAQELNEQGIETDDELTSVDDDYIHIISTKKYTKKK